MTEQNVNRFQDLINSADRPILTDGAMGTMLNARGIEFQECFDALNLDNPAIVADIHRAYIEAGAQIILSNTFGANYYKLAEHGLENKIEDINRTGVELARRVVLASYKDILVAGDVGPLGVRLAPYGRVRPEQAFKVFSEQISILAGTGVDLLVIETISDLAEMKAAVSAAHDVCDLPVVASMTFTRDDLTLLGDSPEKVAKTLWDCGVDVIGVNCSGGPDQILRVLHWMHETVPEARLSAMPNAGWPERLNGRIMYPASPDYFADYVRLFHASGANLIGGCCGTTPEHIAAMKDALENWDSSSMIDVSSITIPKKARQVELTRGVSGLQSKLESEDFVVAVEMDPPRGLSTHKLLAGASLLTEAGADVINIADSPMARMRMSPWAVCNVIQRELNTETTLHFPVRGRNLLRVQGDLLAAHALGIQNVFVVMGDPTEIGDYPDAMDDYDLVPSGLIKLIKQKFNYGIDHAGREIGQPTCFFVGCALNLTPRDAPREIKNLQRKVNAGADFILTQPVYRPDKAKSFLSQYEELYGPLGVPILAGILPLYSARHAAFLHNEVPGIDIPADIQERISSSGKDAPREGVNIALELIEQITSWGNGIYLMPPFHKYDITAEIVEGIRQF
jgi:homocysteine S-methyltransferase